jgi:hypothetical protein
MKEAELKYSMEFKEEVCSIEQEEKYESGGMLFKMIIIMALGIAIAATGASVLAPSKNESLVFDQNGYEQHGYDRSGYNKDGYDKQHCNKEQYCLVKKEVIKIEK